MRASQSTTASDPPHPPQKHVRGFGTRGTGRDVRP
jgi:hypothetical protein